MVESDDLQVPPTPCPHLLSPTPPPEWSTEEFGEWVGSEERSAKLKNPPKIFSTASKTVCREMLSQMTKRNWIS